MPIYSSKLFKNFFGTDEMRAVFTDEARVAQFLRIEVALAKVEAALGIIPVQAYEEIARRAPGLTVNWDRLRRDVEAVGYPVLPFMHQLGEACGSAGEYLHWGSTARDIADTAFVLQLRDALAIVERDALRLRAVLLGMVEAYQSAVMIARTEGEHGVPTTVGFRCAVWLAELDRHLDRLATVRTGLVAGPFGGALGTLAALGDKGLEVQTALMKELGLEALPLSWFSSRDRIAEVVFVLASLASSMAGIARAVVAMARSDVQEMREPGPPGGRAADTIHHRHNTAGCEMVIAHARMASQNVSVVMETLGHDDQRDWQGHLESLVIPQTLLSVHAAVSQMLPVLIGLEVFPTRMRANIDHSDGLFMAESVVTRLAAKTGRRTAHRLVTLACEQALREGCSLREALARSLEVMARMTPRELDQALEPTTYLGCGPHIVAQAIARGGRGRNAEAVPADPPTAVQAAPRLTAAR